MSVCTWKECKEKAKYKKRRIDGYVWVNLCDIHNEEFITTINDAIKLGGRRNIRRILRVWVLANGGAKKMVETM